MIQDNENTSLVEKYARVLRMARAEIARCQKEHGGRYGYFRKTITLAYIDEVLLGLKELGMRTERKGIEMRHGKVVEDRSNIFDKLKQIDEALEDE